MTLGRPTDRHARLSEALGLVDRHVAPAAPLLTGSATGESRYFDLDAIAGRELPGLALGQLGQRFPDMDAPYDDATFAAALYELDLEVSDAGQREALYRAWTAQRVLNSIRDLLAELSQTPTPDVEEADWERAQLTRLGDAPLPTLDRAAVEAALSGLGERDTQNL